MEEFDELELIEGGEDVEEEDEDEALIMRRRALVVCVQRCPALYATNKKEYSGKNFNKDLAWETIAQSQVPPITGEAAGKEFYAIRQKFRKEKLKVHPVLVSGQAARSPVKSQWPLYDDCLFLAEHIKPRKTKSNYQKKVDSAGSSSQSSSIGTPNSRPSSSSSGMFGSLWSSDILIMENDSPGDSSETPFSESEVSTASDCKIIEAVTTAAKQEKRQVPEPDAFANKKKKKEDVLLQNMLEQGKALTAVAQQVGQALRTQPAAAPATAPPPAPPSHDDLLIAPVKYAMVSVPEEQRLTCLVEVLALINKYAKK